jgi:hypothetical protein
MTGKQSGGIRIIQTKMSNGAFETERWPVRGDPNCVCLAAAPPAAIEIA